MLNGMQMTAKDTEAKAFLSGLYETNSLEFEVLKAWLQENTASL